MKRFSITTEGSDRFALVVLCQRYCAEQWLADHATPEQAAAMMQEQFRRAVSQELELIEFTCREAESAV